MPSVRYFNQSAPFWDFVASLEEQGQDHPLLAGFRGGPPPSAPPQYEVETGAAANPEQQTSSEDDGAATAGEKDTEMKDGEKTREGPSGEIPHRGPGPHGHHGHHGHHGPRGFHKRGGHCGGRGREGFGGWGGFGGRCGGGEGRERGERWGGPWEGRRHRGPPGGGFGGFAGFPFAFGGRGPWAEWMEAYKSNEKSGNNGDFTPEVDVFDSEELYTIHVSLPGANKEDVAVNWDADKSALTVAGVVTRPGDEAFLKDLAMDERKVGVFERVVKLGNERHPANVDQDAISAKFENGILIIEIPKAERDYVDVKKVDIQ